MAAITLTSASGSPGVTTASLGLALAWPRPVLLVEADPTGGSGLLAGYFRGTREYDGGLIELALSANDVCEALAEVARPIENTTVSYVAGTRSHTQATALTDVWHSFLREVQHLESAGQDIIVDAGRLGLRGSPEPLIAEADLTLLVARTTLPALSAVRSWADTLKQNANPWRKPAALIVGSGQPYGIREVANVLGIPIIATLADDPESAAVLHRGAEPTKRFNTSPLTRSFSAAAASIQSLVAHRRAELLEGMPT